jgi:hypothetical protein
VGEQIVARHHHQVVVHVLAFEHEMQISNGTQLVRVVGGPIVDDREGEPGFDLMTGVGPLLELGGEPGVGHHVNALDALDRCQVVQDVIDHRLPRHRQQRLRPGQGQWIEAGGVPGRKYDHFHVGFVIANRRCPARQQ